MKKAILAGLMAMIALNGLAYDFYIVNGTGEHLFFNLLSDSQAQITYESRLSPTPSYSGSLFFPETVNYDGKTLTVTSVSDYAFFGCRDISQVCLPSTVTSVGRWAFAWCDAITDLELPSSLAHITPDAFDGCFSLAALSVAPGNSSFKVEGNVLLSADGSKVVAVVPTAEGVLSVPDGSVAIGSRALGGCTFIDSIALPQSLRSIESDALGFCNSLKSLVVPASVESIGRGALADCYSLSSINVEPGNAFFTSHGGILYNADSSVLLQSPGACLNPAIHRCAAEIAPMAFMHNYGITSVLLPESVVKVGDGAFAGCENLVSVLIPGSVSEIGAMAFGLCSSLRTLYVMNSFPEEIAIGEGAFAGVDTELCVLYVPRGAKSRFLHLEQWRDFRSIVETDPLLEQTISWIPETDEYTDDSHITLHASSSAMLSVEYALSPYSTGIATLQDDVLECIVPGAVDVIAYQRGNNTYLPAAPVVRTFFDPNSGADDLVVDTNIRVYGIRGAIVIRGAQDDDVAQVFDINGIAYYTGADRQIAVPAAGIYAVRIDGSTFKVLVR